MSSLAVHRRPAHSRREPRALSRPAQRRRRATASRRALAAAVASLAVAIVLAIATLAVARRPHRRGTPRASTPPRTRAAPPQPRSLSPTGLPLGKPALALAGLGDPAQDPVHIAFQHPPRAGLLFNLETGQVLWQRNPLARLRIASLTKMMTALLTVELAPPDAPRADHQAAVDMPRLEGRRAAARQARARWRRMLYGLLLPSGNDAAVALAQHVAGSVSALRRAHERRGGKLGMGCTRYSSPSGYYDAGNYSCAADLAVLAHVDLEQPRIAQHRAHLHAPSLPFPIKGGKLYLYNNNPLLIYRYPGTTGLKTGYTEAAGRCLVATAERHGVRLGVVLLHSPDPGTQARAAAEPRLRGRLPPGARARAADARPAPEARGVGAR